MRIICLDVGSKRIGVAASDPLGITAAPVCVILRHGGVKDFEEIAGLCREYEPGLILVGLPLNEESELGAQAKKIKAFSESLEKYLIGVGIKIPFKLWDERYSTALAEERLIEADVSRKKRKKVIDKMAALVILQCYLESGEKC